MRRHRARTSRLRHRLPAHEIILFRLLPRSSLARRRLALDTARIPSRAPTPFARRPLAAFTPAFAPLDCAAPPRLVRSTKGLFPPRSRARARWRRRDATVEPETWRAQTRHSRGLNSFPRRLSRLSRRLARDVARGRLAPRRAKEFPRVVESPRETSRRSRARVRRRTRDVRERTVGFHGPTDARIRFDSMRPVVTARRRARRATNGDRCERNSSTFLARERGDGDSVTTESVTNR